MRFSRRWMGPALLALCGAAGPALARAWGDGARLTALIEFAAFLTLAAGLIVIWPRDPAG